MKTVMMILAAVSVIAFDITTVTVTFCWICGALDLNNAQGVSLLGMWIVAGFITTVLVEIVSEL